MKDFENTYGFSEVEWHACLRVLSVLKDDPFHNPDNQRLASLVTLLYKKAKKINRKASYSHKKSKNLITAKSLVIAQNALNNSSSYSVGEIN